MLNINLKFLDYLFIDTFNSTLDLRRQLFCCFSYSYQYLFFWWFLQFLAKTTSLQHTKYSATTLQSVNSVNNFNPINWKHKKTQPTSCYAIFTGWLLPSLPHKCLRNFTFLKLSYYIGLYWTVWAVSLLTLDLIT